MKIPASVREIYYNHLQLNERLKEIVDIKVVSLKQPQWHYESRVKKLESFALKLETGRFPNPSQLEDFFACTLVVSNLKEIDEAEKIISDRFFLHERRPQRKDYTHKDVHSFQFDDLRLYVKLGSDSISPPRDIDNIVFEFQIKTFLQHAWLIATHDLIYKANEVNWSKERIAYQIKAMLEHAELAIQEAELLSQSPVLKKDTTFTVNISNIVGILKENWTMEELPFDTLRLAKNIMLLLDAIKLKPKDLGKILKIEKEAANGNFPLNLSPFAVTVQSLLRQEKSKMRELLTNKNGKFSLLVHAEVDFPTDFPREDCCRAIFLGQSVP